MTKTPGEVLREVRRSIGFVSSDMEDLCASYEEIIRNLEEKISELKGKVTCNGCGGTLDLEKATVFCCDECAAKYVHDLEFQEAALG